MNFITIVPENAIVFRGVSEHNKITSNWFCLNLSDTNQYGSRKFIFKANKNLRLIDLTDINFHNDYLSKVNKMFGNAIDKMYYLIPIGLPDYDAQIKFMRLKNFPIPNSNTQLSDDNIILLNCLQNKSRYSEYSIDKNFTDMLKQIYGSETDGYIIQNPWPTKIGNGVFMPELYVYNTDDISLIHELPHTGGTTSELSLKDLNLTINNNIKTRESNDKSWNKKEEKVLPEWVRVMHESLSNLKQSPVDVNTIITGWNRHNIRKEQQEEMEKLSELTNKIFRDAKENPPYMTMEKFMKTRRLGAKTRRKKKNK